MNKPEMYFALTKSRPTLFENPPGASYEILLDQADIQKAESEMIQKGIPAEWAQVGIAFQDQYTIILRDAVRFPNGDLGTYIRNVGYDVPGVIVLPVYQEQILLIRHFRHATRSWYLELPRGFGNVGSSGEENARRELFEEIGGTVSRLVLLGSVCPDAGAVAGYNDFFYAEVMSYGELETDEAIVELLPTPVTEFERMVRENEIHDGFTLTAYALAKVHNLL